MLDETRKPLPPQLEDDFDPTEGLPLFVNVGLPMRDADIERLAQQDGA